MRRTMILAAVLLAACGQSGDLYLPGETEAAPAPAPVPGTSSAPVTPEAEKKKD